jgi:hypothetical protein
MFQPIDAALLYPALGLPAGWIPAVDQALVAVQPMLDYHPDLELCYRRVQPFFPPAQEGEDYSQRESQRKLSRK